jgi:hypothetical protein
VTPPGATAVPNTCNTVGAPAHTRQGRPQALSCACKMAPHEVCFGISRCNKLYRKLRGNSATSSRITSLIIDKFTPPRSATS